MGKKYKKLIDQPAAPSEIMELEAAQLDIPAIEELIDFEGWYALRKDDIPRHHRAEVIKADFKGRKVPELATMAQFDEALGKYGIKLV